MIACVSAAVERAQMTSVTADVRDAEQRARVRTLPDNTQLPKKRRARAKETFPLSLMNQDSLAATTEIALSLQS
jgi:hypothetical protein